MKIAVTAPKEKLILQFMPYVKGELRLWIRNPKEQYQTVGLWCPHINRNNDECQDCALVLEG